MSPRPPRRQRPAVAVADGAPASEATSPGLDARPAALQLGLVGCDFRCASTRWRSALVLSRTERHALLDELRREGVVEGLVTLDTCNRNEWLFAAPNPGWAAEILKVQMLKRWQSMGTPHPRPYVKLGGDAVRHVLRVGAGLASFVVGERQITTQLNRAIEQTRREGNANVHLTALGAAAARVAREIHAHHVLTGEIRGVHDLAVGRLSQELPTGAAVLVVGTGEIGRRVESALRTAGFRTTVMNRTAGRQSGGPLPLSELPAVVVDAIVACTAAPDPVVVPALLPRGVRLLVDLGIPSQVERACGAIPGLRRLDLDDLLASGSASAVPPEALEAAELIVEAGVRDYASFCARRRFVALLDQTRRNHEDFVERVLPGLLDEIVPSDDPVLRGKVEYRLRGLLRRYTSSIFRSINDSIPTEP